MKEPRLANLPRIALAALCFSSLANPPQGFAQDVQRTAEHQFVASSRGRVYYWIGCKGWNSLVVANLRYFKSAADAKAKGYTPSTQQGCAGPPEANRVVPGIGASALCLVARIVDGDTFDCRSGDRVRLLLVDAPEMAQQTWGDSAQKALAALIPVGTSVRLEFDVDLRDRYERLLAYVYRGSLLVNRELARRGVVVVSIFPPNVKHVETIRAAVDSARTQRAGLWRVNAFECPPGDYRAGRCRQ